MARKLIFSLCDHSGNWTRPYAERENDYLVIRVDPKHANRTGDGRGIVENDHGIHQAYKMADGGWAVGMTAGELAASIRLTGVEATVYSLTGISGYDRVHGIVCQPPCTDFTVSGAQYWPKKDADGRTAQSLQIVDECLEVVNVTNPAWWVLENPVGRLPKLRADTLGKYLRTFHPWMFGDAYTKLTCLWGRFNKDLPENRVDPIRACEQGSWLQKLGGKSEKTKELRSATPMGFAYAFATANP